MTKRRRKKNRLKRAFTVLLMGVLVVVFLLLIGVGGYALHLYGKMQIEDVGESTIAQSKVNASIALENGVSLDTILSDESNYRFTLQDVEELKYHYMDWLESQNGEEDSETGTTIDIWKDPPAEEKLPLEAEKLYNILFLGTDEREGEITGRTDSIVMVTVNTEKKTITLTSFLRDTYVKLSGTDSYNRINTAYVFGGVGAIQNTITDYIGLEFDNYAKVNFASFTEVIDAIGGIDMELTEKEVSNLKKHTALDSSEGVFDPEQQRVEGTENVYHLNGKYALRYCRDRYTGDGDFGRTERQRKVLIKIIEKAQAMSFNELMRFIPIVLPLITTDLTVGDCTSLLASVGTSYSSYTIQSFRVPADQTWSYETVNGMSVLGVNFDENRRQLHSLVFD